MSCLFKICSLRSTCGIHAGECFHNLTAALFWDVSITLTLGLLHLLSVQPSRRRGSAAFSGHQAATGWPAAPLRAISLCGIVTSQGAQGHTSQSLQWNSPALLRSVHASRLGLYWVRSLHRFIFILTLKSFLFFLKIFCWSATLNHF